MTRFFAPDSALDASSMPAWLPTAPDAACALEPSVPPRAPQRQSLTDAAHVWLARIPPRFQPLATAREHPHIVNRLAELWSAPDRLATYFDDLLLSGRPRRRGFAFDVLAELFDLQALVAEPRPH